MVNIGESREALTEVSRPSSPTITVGALRVYRRSAVVFAGVLVCTAVAVAVLAISFSPQQQQQEYQQPLQQQAQQKSQQASQETTENSVHPRSLPPTTPPPPPPPTTLRPPPPPVEVSVSTRNNRANRLPTTLRPIHYLVQLQPFIDGNFSIIGHVEVDFEVLEPTPNVTLNILDIVTRNETIKVSSLGDSSSTLGITQHLYHHEDQTYTAVLSESLELGQSYTLSMDFEGYLNDQLTGFYRSSYTDVNGTTKFLAVTQFEAADARRAFPCFDEPAMKATFDVHLARDVTKRSISNMPLNRTEPVDGQDGWVWDIYDTTVPMSTYLVAFVVSDFTYSESDANNQVRFRVWAREEAISQADYALQIGPDCLIYYEEYFNVSFPLPKLDMIAVPDFSAHAMENWGLITYRETALLFDPVVSSWSNEVVVAVVTTHELAHQWFGNLVTLKWWNDLWLNEGFATFVTCLGTDHIEPTWRCSELFVNIVLQYVMGLDSLESSHPISVEVTNTGEIAELFDDISYFKGGSIIRMMFFFLTEENFKKGITSYLNKFEYGNAEQEDLWTSLTEAVADTDLLPEGATVKTIMDTWTLQMGFPVVKVVRNEAGTTATVTQERFLQVKSMNSTDTHDFSWWVPLTYTTADELNFTNTVPKQWMTETQKEVTVTDLPTSDMWVIFNVQQSSYYKVNYDDENWNLLTAQLEDNHTVINVINRAQILDDALDLAAAGQLSYDTALSLNSYLDKEEEYIPWQSALDNLGYLEQMFTRTGGYGDLRMYLLSLLESLYQSVGFEEGADDDKLVHFKRDLTLSWTCHLGHMDCVNNSVSMYQAWMSNGTVVSPNLRSTVYCTGIAEGGEEAWNFGWLQYLETNVGSEKDNLLRALGCAKEVWILSRYLNMAFTEDSGIRKQDASTVVSAVSRNDIGRDLAWNYLRDQWQTVANYFGSFTMLSELVKTVSGEFNTQEEQHQLELFKEEHADQLGTATRAIDQAIEQVANNIDWMNANYVTIVQWLDNHLNPPKPTRKTN